MTRAEQSILSRMREIREEVRSGATEMVGKTYRGADDRIAGRYGGGMEKMFPELRRAAMSPGEAAKAVELGKGKRFRRLYRAIAEEYGFMSRTRKRGRLAVPAHPGMKSCKHCRGAHTAGEHRFHGPGSFHATHAFSFGGNPMYEGSSGYFHNQCGTPLVSGEESLYCPKCKKPVKRMADIVHTPPKKYIKPSKNNPSPGTVIYGRVLAVEAQKTGKHLCDDECKRYQHRYRHDFKKGAVMYGLPDGSILIRAD